MKSSLIRALLFCFGLPALLWSQSTVSVNVTGNAITGTGQAVINLAAIAGNNENTVAFTLNWDPTVLSYVSNALGSSIPTDGSAGIQRNATPALTSTGKLTAAIALESGTSFTAGTKQLLIVNFTVINPAASTAITFTDSPTFRRVVNADGQSLTSAVFANTTITANPAPSAPVFTNTITSATFLAGQANSFQFTASGFPVATFSTSSTLPSGVTLSSSGLLSGNPTTFAGSPYSLNVAATNSAGTANQTFALTVHAVPVISSQPVDRTIALGSSTTFTVVVLGNPTPTIQWQTQEPGTTDWTNVGNGTQHSGVTTTTLTVNATVDGLNGWKYRAVASNGIGSAIVSNPATLTVLYPPAFFQQPESQTVNLNSTVTFTANAMGSPVPTLQWQKSTNGGSTWTNVDNIINKISGATTTTLQIQGALGGSDAGSYRAVATNSQGSVNSNVATLNFNTGIATGGTSPTTGSQGTLVTINGAGFTGATAVRFNGVDAASFAVVSQYQITAVVPTFATTGVLSIVTASSGTLNGPDFTVTPGPRFANLRSIGQSNSGEGALMANFTIEGTGTKAVLLRAPGPALGGTSLADPFLSLYNSAGVQIGSNDDWDSSLAATFTAVGAPGFPAGSKDAALLVNLAPGTYTARVTGKGASGFTMVEVFEADTVTTSRLLHVARRSPNTSGNNNTNFKLTGAGMTTLLVRAVTSGLGIPNTLTEPVIMVNTSATIHTLNTNSADLAAATAAVGAMPLGANGVAGLITLPAGEHNVMIAGAGTGVVMTEIHIVDSFRPAAFSPAILAPLHSQNPPLGGTVTFAAPSLGKLNPTFQWQKGGANIDGQTNATLTITNATAANNGSYRVAMTNSSGTVTSGAADVGVAKAAQTIDFAAIPATAFSLGGTVTITAKASSNLLVTFASSNPTVASVSTGTLNTTTGVTTATLTIGDVGSTIITASQAGDDNFLGAPNIPQTFVVNKGTATVTITGLAATFDFTQKPVTVTTVPGPLPVDVTYTPTGGTATATPPTNAGTYTVVATVNHNHYQGTRTETLVIAKANQTITFDVLPAKTFGDAPFTITATTTSPHTVVFTSLDPAVATVGASTFASGVASATVTILTGGTARIVASEAGGVNFNPATPVERTLTVAKAAATVALTNLTHTYNGAVKGAGADVLPSLTPPLNVSFTYTGTASSTTAPTNAGSYGVTATVVDSRYQGSATGTITINKATQTIAFDPALSVALDQSPVALTATATGGPVTFSISNPSTGTVATLSGSMLTLVNTGTIDVTVNAAANANYNAATPVTRTLTVTGQSQTITFDAAQLPAKTYSPSQTFSISAASNRSGYLIAFTTSDAAVATIATGTLGADSRTTTATVTIVGAGTATITATQAGDANTGTATPVPRTLTVAKAAATVTLTPATLAQVFNNTPRAVTATTVPAGLNVAFTYTPTGGTASATAPTNAGTYAVTATITGTTPPESNYTGTASGTLVISKATQTIAFTDFLSPKVVTAGAFSLTADASSGLPITFTSSNPAVATIGGAQGNIATVLALGSTTITASQAGDANYNAATPFARPLVVNPVAPVITSHPSLAQTVIVGSNLFFGPVTLNANSAPTTFSIAVTPAGLSGVSVNPATGSVSGTLTGTPGIYNIVLTATNTSGSDSKTIVLTLNPPAPVFTSPASITGTVNVAGFSYTAVATNIVNASGYTLTGTLPAGLTFSNGVISGTPAVGTAGTYPVTLTATNVTGSASLALSIRILANPNSPVITSSALVNGQVGAPLSYTLTSSASGTGGGTPTYALSGTLPSGLTLTSGVVSGTPAAGSAGTFHVFFVASNSNGAGLPLEVTFVIAPAATAPVISSNGTAAGQVGQPFSYTITASGSPTSYTATGLPAGLTLTGNVISGSPTAETPVGTPANVTLTATNGAGASNPKTLLITITAGPGTPVITSGLQANLRVGVTGFSYTITASPTATSFTATGLPPGLSLTGAVISGTATQSDVFDVTLRGINGSGTGPASTLQLNVLAPLGAPAISSAASASGTVGTVFTYNILAAPGTILVYGVDGTLPLGLSLNTTSGVISGTPSVAGLTTVEITATSSSGTSLPQALVINIAPAAGVPVITSPGSVSSRAGEAFSYTITATNVGTAPYAPSVVLEAINLPAGLAANPSTGQIQGVPTTVGNTTASLVGTNAVGTGPSRTLDISILPATSAPVIAGAALASAQAGVAFTYGITLAPTSPAATGYEVLGAPAWLTLNSTTGALTGTPTVPGQVQVQLIARNTAGASLPVALTINVAAAANTPVITSTRTSAGTTGAAFAGYQIEATNTPIASYLAVGLPPGLTLNTATGAITGTPTSSGVYPVVVSAANANGVGAAVVVTFTIARSVTFGL